MFRSIKSVDDLYDVFKNIDIRDNIKNESCESVSKEIWFRLNMICLFAVERS